MSDMRVLYTGVKALPSMSQSQSQIDVKRRSARDPYGRFKINQRSGLWLRRENFWAEISHHYPTDPDLAANFES